MLLSVEFILDRHPRQRGNLENDHQEVGDDVDVLSDIQGLHCFEAFLEQRHLLGDQQGSREDGSDSLHYDINSVDSHDLRPLLVRGEL